MIKPILLVLALGALQVSAVSISAYCNVTEATTAVSDGGYMLTFSNDTGDYNNTVHISEYVPTTTVVVTLGGNMFSDFLVYAEDADGKRVGCFDAVKTQGSAHRSCSGDSCSTLGRLDVSTPTGPAQGLYWSAPCNYGTVTFHALVADVSGNNFVVSKILGGSGVSCTGTNSTTTPTPTPTPSATPTPTTGANPDGTNTNGDGKSSTSAANSIFTPFTIVAALLGFCSYFFVINP